MKFYIDFFKDSKISSLVSRKDGYKYVAVYQMLCLNSINTFGKIENFENKKLLIQKLRKNVAPFLNYDYQFFENALSKYLKLNLIYKKDGEYYISNYDKFVGNNKSPIIYKSKNGDEYFYGKLVKQSIASKKEQEYIGNVINEVIE